MTQNHEEMKKEVDELLGREAKEGYRPRLVTFQKKDTCRMCDTDTSRGWRVMFLGKRVETSKLFLYCFATVCEECFTGSHEATKDRLAAMMVSAVTGRN